MPRDAETSALSVGGDTGHKVNIPDKEIHVGLVGTPEEFRSLSPEMARQIASALASVTRMLNDREMIARVNKMYYDGASLRNAPGFDSYLDSTRDE